MEKKRILVVEDEAITALDLEEALVRLGYEVVGSASTGEDAVAKAKDKKPDLVIMDIHLQGEMDGVRAAEEIWNALKTPCIFLTSYADEATLSRAKLTNPYGYMLKPYDEDELRVTVDLALHRLAERAVPRETEAPSSKASEVESTETLGDIDPALHPVVTTLRKVPVFSDLPLRALAQLAQTSDFRHVSAGTYLQSNDQEDVPPFVVTQGRVAIMQNSPEGKELNVGLFGQGDLLGVLLALHEGAPFAQLKVQRDAVLLILDAEVLNTVLDENSAVFKEIMQHTLERMRQLQDFAFRLAHQRVETKIADALHTVMLDFGVFDKGTHSYTIDLTRLELAELCGSTPETAIRVTKAMERQGILDLTQPSRIRVLKSDHLQELAGTQG